MMHHPPRPRLYVHTQKGFCVGWPYIEPPVTEVERQTIHVINGFCLPAISLLQCIELALDIAHPVVDFATAHPLIEGFEQLGERLACHRKEVKGEEQHDQTRSARHIDREVQVTRAFHSE